MAQETAGMLALNWNPGSWTSYT